MTEANFRKLVLLADVRATMNDVNRLLEKLTIDLRRCINKQTEEDPFYAAVCAAEDFQTRIIDLREILGKKNMAVPK